LKPFFVAAAGNGDVKELASLLEQGARINDTDVRKLMISLSMYEGRLTTTYATLITRERGTQLYKLLRKRVAMTALRSCSRRGLM
jgi:hypothetical protein